MKSWQKWSLRTIGVAVASFLITPAIWPPPANLNPGSYLPLFILLSVFGSVAPALRTRHPTAC
jgi:hypothetical protein